MKPDAAGEAGRPPLSPPAERLGEMTRRIHEWLSESLDRAEALREILEQMRQEPSAAATEPPQAPQRDREPLAGLARFAWEMEARTDQAGILDQLVSGAASAAGRAILFVVRGESLAGWTSRGFAPGFNPRGISLPVAADNLLAQAISLCGAIVETPSSREGNAALADLLGGPGPREMVAAPIWIRDRVAAILYADQGQAGGACSPEAIRVMASLAGLSLEALPYRRQHPRPVCPEPQAREPEIREAEVREAEVGEAEATPAPPPAAAIPTGHAADPEETRLLEEARRFARLLVSEIVLYNGAQVEEGRRQKDIYQRLKEEIDRSRQMYEQRVSPRVPGSTDYFRQELVRVLAQGDESAIALPWA